ncbi:hypothetical protein BJ741DRAFT_229386 [Chytriomyces cf. hyalinus JEL632]|nr:hypothetical protein BJ741DRAFT_229386 [Chytriomyces cf. hyalinus JEL632]
MAASAPPYEEVQGISQELQPQYHETDLKYSTLFQPQQSADSKDTLSGSYQDIINGPVSYSKLAPLPHQLLGQQSCYHASYQNLALPDFQNDSRRPEQTISPRIPISQDDAPLYQLRSEMNLRANESQERTRSQSEVPPGATTSYRGGTDDKSFMKRFFKSKLGKPKPSSDRVQQMADVREIVKPGISAIDTQLSNCVVGSLPKDELPVSKKQFLSNEERTTSMLAFSQAFPREGATLKPNPQQKSLSREVPVSLAKIAAPSAPVDIESASNNQAQKTAINFSFPVSEYPQLHVRYPSNGADSIKDLESASPSRSSSTSSSMKGTFSHSDTFFVPNDAPPCPFVNINPGVLDKGSVNQPILFPANSPALGASNQINSPPRKFIKSWLEKWTRVKIPPDAMHDLAKGFEDSKNALFPNASLPTTAAEFQPNYTPEYRNIALPKNPPTPETTEPLQREAMFMPPPTNCQIKIQNESSLHSLDDLQTPKPGLFSRHQTSVLNPTGEVGTGVNTLTEGEWHPVVLEIRPDGTGGRLEARVRKLCIMTECHGWMLQGARVYTGGFNVGAVGKDYVLRVAFMNGRSIFLDFEHADAMELWQIALKFRTGQLRVGPK